MLRRRMSCVRHAGYGILLEVVIEMTDDNLAKARYELCVALYSHMGKDLGLAELDIVNYLVCPDVLEFTQAFIDEARVALVKDLGKQHISVTRVRAPSTAHDFVD